MHIADAVMTPSIVLFGPTCAVKNGPVYRGVPMSVNVSCSPCQYDPHLRDTCEDPRCMIELTVDSVLRQVDLILGDRPASKDREA
jgi:ADP-heptose:LPS heptosyltransferase